MHSSTPPIIRHSLPMGRGDQPSTMTNDDLDSLFRNLCGIEMTDANRPHRLLRLTEHEARPDVINQAALRLLQVIQQASPSIPEPYVKWMSDRVLTACNMMLSAAEPRAPVLTPVLQPAPPPVPQPSVVSPRWDPPVVRTTPYYRRPTISAGEIVLGVVSLVVVLLGIGFGLFVFTNPRPSPKSQTTRTPSPPSPTPLALPQGGGRPSPTPSPSPVPMPQPITEGDGGGGKNEALAHLKTAVSKLRQGLLDVGMDYARKAWKEPRYREAADTVQLVSGYLKQYARLSDEALHALNNNNLEVDLGPEYGKCAFVDKGDGWIKFRVNGMNRQFSIQELTNLVGVRFRITSGYLDNASNPANDLILGSYQYVHGLDDKGVPARKGVNPIPNRWVTASQTGDPTTRDQAALMLKLPPLELVK